MSCECAQCRQNYKVLGFVFGVPSESEIHEAYREGVKQWHPDLYENFASLRADAEEHFKQIQVAYRELKEHNGSMEELPLEGVDISPIATPPAAPPISFDGASGCLVASQFTTEVEEVIARFLGKSDTAMAIIDLSDARSRAASYTHFLILAMRGIMVRDARNIVSLLWYKDLGAVNLIEKRKDEKQSLSQKLFEKVAGGQPNCSLQIYRGNGTLFYSLADPVDDNVKKVIYSFLLRQKSQAQP